jgi:hypothetical protein
LVRAGKTAGSNKELPAMPQKEHLPSVSAKEQRMYEHIKASEQKQGRSTKSAKAIAAATVVKHHNEEDHPKSK